MKRISFFTILFILLFGVDSYSQQNNFNKYSVDDGLAQSTVYSILQDSRGYLWLGTDGGGASRFDGINFKTFNKKNGLAGNLVRSIIEDHLGNIWFGTDEGISVYNGASFQTINFSKGLCKGKILKLFKDSKNNIWAGSDEGGVSRIIQGDTLSIKTITSAEGLLNDFIFDIQEDQNNRIWLASFYGGLNVLTFDKTEKFYIQKLKRGDLPSDLIVCIKKDEKGNLWCGTTDAGIFKIETNLKVFPGKIKSYGSADGLIDLNIWDILPAENGVLWLASNANGIIRLKDDPKPEFKTYHAGNGLPGNQIMCLFRDLSKTLWIGTYGSGFCSFQGETLMHFTENEGLPKSPVFNFLQKEKNTYWLASYGSGLIEFAPNFPKKIVKSFTKKDGLVDNFTRSLTKDPNGNIWIATAHGISKFNGRSFTNYTDVDGLVDNSVNTILADHRGIVWCGTSSGVSRFDGKRFLTLDESRGFINNYVQSIIEDKKGNIWFGTLGGLAKYFNNQLVTFDEVEGLNFKEVYALAEDYLGNIWIGTHGGGLFKLDVKSKQKKMITLVADEKAMSSNIVYSLAFANQNTLIVGTNKGFDKIVLDANQKIKQIKKYDKTNGFSGVENNSNALLRDSEGNIWFGTIKGITKYKPSLERNNLLAPITHLTSLKLNFENIDWKTRSDSILPWFNLPHDLKLNYSDNHLTFNFSGISLSNPVKVMYKYKLEGWDKEWSPPRKENEVTYSGIAPGDYSFQVLSVNENGIWNSSPEVFRFTIKPPWYKTTWFYILSIVTAIVSIYSYIKIRERKLMAEKRVLERKVEERTREVVKQKEVIEEKNKDITDSINYAKRIQTAILPSSELISENLQQSFVLFKPKDIVSGDFYFFTEVKEDKKSKFIIAAVDCTGHGVPGAFMSMIGNSLLNQIIKEKHISQPSEILNNLHEGVREALKQNEINAETRDGMDLALCLIDGDKVQYAGANRPLYLIKNNELEEIKADKFPIGGVQSEEKRKFTNHALKLGPGDSVYLTTDGYADQFGGPESKKFMTKHFKNLLLSIHQKPMAEQRDILNNTIEEWRGNLEQIDDICLIGLRF